MKQKKYYASVYPDSLGNGEYDGNGSFSVLDDAYDNNRMWLVIASKRAIGYFVFAKYPVILDIAENKTGRSIERWRLDEKGGRWTRILFAF